MLSHRIALAFVVATLAVYAAAAQGAARETIIVRFRPPNGLCVGVCPNFEMRVSPQGRVVTRDTWSGRIERFDIDLQRLAAFRDVLIQLRPLGERREDETCEQALHDGKADALDDPRPDDIEVRWIDRAEPGRLTACARNMAVRRVVQDALRALGVTILGTRKNRE
jgi:hypothetical protein